MYILDNREKSEVLAAIQGSKSQVLRRIAKRRLNYLETFELAQLLSMCVAIALGATFAYNGWSNRVNICETHWGAKNSQFIAQYGIGWPNLEYDLGDCRSHANNNAFGELCAITLLLWVPTTLLGIWIHSKIVDHKYKSLMMYLEDELKELGEDFRFVLDEPSLERRIELLNNINDASTSSLEIASLD
jgi:hypothetical protein